MKKILLALALCAVAGPKASAVVFFPLGAVWHTDAKGPKRNVAVTFRRGENEYTTQGKAPGDFTKIYFENARLRSVDRPQWREAVNAGAGTFRPAGEKTVAIIIDRKDNDEIYLVGVEIPDNYHGRTTVKFDDYQALTPDTAYKFYTTKHSGRKKNETARLFRVTKVPLDDVEEYVVQFAEVPE